MGAREKTSQLIRIGECPLSLLVKNEDNPNRMRPREFDLLCDNMNTTGWTDPALVRPYDLKDLRAAKKEAGKDEDKLVQLMLERDLKLRIVGGHHRFDAASYLGMETGPVTVIMDPGFDDEMEKFQVVRMNVIHGKMDPQSFTKMYESVAEKYSDDLLQDMFGFADEAEFKKLVQGMAKSLPDKHMQDKFKEAAKEIKTIDGLAKLLNHMFSTYGDTLPHGYMIFDYGGQRSLWLQTSKKTMNALDVVGQICMEKQRTMDDVLGAVVQLIAKEGQTEFIDALMEELAETPIPDKFPVNPTKDNLAKALDSL